MTSTPIVDIGQLVTYTQEAGGVLPTTGGTGFMDSLKTAMNDMQNESIESLKPTEKTGTYDTKSDQMSANRDKVKPEVKEDNKTAKSDGKKEEITPKQKEAIGEKAEEVINKVADEMDVAPEEVIEAMETLGLTLVDLFNPDNMTDLVATLSGNQDALSILTDENLYQTLGEIQNFVGQITEDLTNELDLSQEALNEVLKQAEELLEQSVITETTEIPQESLENAAMTGMVNAENEEPLEGMKDFKATSIVDGKEVTVSVEVDESTGASVSTVEKTELTQSDNKDSSEQKPADRDSDENHSQASFITQTTQFNNLDTSDVMNITDQITSFTSETRDIADQIMESMKANLKADMTELEMNLHPASLGNVRVNLTAQNGQITAQFIAQNETVRAAIESQVTQLTNQLEDQGIKVEHVEVSIADYRFDRGNEGGSQENNNSENKSGKPKVGRVRRIDMSAIESEEDLEELEDSDRIAAEMMAHDGNTVDYTA